VPGKLARTVLRGPERSNALRLPDNTAADHIAVVTAALAQLPRRLRRSRGVLIRADSAGGTHAFLDWVHRRRLGYSVGFTLPDDAAELIARLPAAAWTPAYDADRQPRPARSR